MPLKFYKIVSKKNKKRRMNKVLIIADGNVSKTFIKRVTREKIRELDYVVIAKSKGFLKDIDSKEIEYHILDATSLYNLRKICSKDKFNSVFILSEDAQESVVIYRNIRMINKKIRIIALDTNCGYENIEDSYLNILDANEILANRLYDFLPNVPLVAQSIGLNKGEIMEIVVPFASAFSYRHISSIPQKKWKIVAIYRDNKLLMPTNDTMIKPRDRILVVGNPNVLMNVYKRVKNKSGQFPEPYGKNFYLFLDMEKDGINSLVYMKEAIYLLDKFEKKELIVRVCNPNDFKILNKLKELESDNIRLSISYETVDEGVVFSDIQKYDIGLILLSYERFKYKKCAESLSTFKKLVYLFGDTRLNRIKESIIIHNEKKDIEEISTIAFYIAEALKTKLTFADFDPKGDFENTQKAIEHLEVLSQVHNYPIDIVKEQKNPIQAIKFMKDILVVMPFRNDIKVNDIFAYFKRDINTLLLKMDRHPKLLIPTVEG